MTPILISSPFFDLFLPLHDIFIESNYYPSYCYLLFTFCIVTPPTTRTTTKAREGKWFSTLTIHQNQLGNFWDFILLWFLLKFWWLSYKQRINLCKALVWAIWTEVFFFKISSEDQYSICFCKYWVRVFRDMKGFTEIVVTDHKHCWDNTVGWTGSQAFLIRRYLAQLIVIHILP